MNKKLTIAITGGSGFIGKLLVKAHLDRGDIVRVLTRSVHKSQPKAVAFYGDLLDANSDLSEFFSDVDIFYHCAGELHNESLMERLHIDGMKLLLRFAIGHVGRWVQLSSVGAYGPCSSNIVNEESKENPLNLYEETKTKADCLLRRASKAHNLQYAILRPSIVFGESMSNQSLRQMSTMIAKRLFFYIDKEAKVNYVHVDDVVSALMLCGQRDEALGKTYILSSCIKLEDMVQALANGSGVKAPDIQISEPLARHIAKLFGRFPYFPLTESRLDALTSQCIYDASAFKKDLGFSFQRTLEEEFYLYAKSIT